ncbi:MAG: PcfJ domain-containing protein [Oscillospiraceae bacterium]|nr:PcfJ domain-containing protein [Oscillospiraceae bacterium]
MDKRIRNMPWPKGYRCSGRTDCRVTVALPVVDHTRYLVVDIVMNSAKCASTAAFRAVCTKTGPEVCVLSDASKTGKQVTLTDCMHSSCYCSPRTCYPEISKEDEGKLARWLGTKETKNHQMDNLEDWIEEALAAVKVASLRRRGELLDEEVSLCPEALPEGMEAWIRRKILATDNTLVYKKGNIRGLCYLCGNEVRATAKRFRQSERVTCPSCGEPTLCVLSGGASCRADYVANMIAAQQGTDGETVFFRQWHLKRDPTAQYTRISDWLEEFGRYAARGYCAARWLREYKYNYFSYAKRYNMEQWTRFRGVEVYDGSYQFYAASIVPAVAGTRLQYADIPGYYNTAEDKFRDGGYGYHNVVRYALDWTRYPVMEFLWKAGYRGLVFERVRGIEKNYRNAILWNRKSGLKDCFRFPLRLLKLKRPAEWTMQLVWRAGELWRMKEQGALRESELPALLDADVDLKLLAGAARYAKLSKIVAYVGDQAGCGADRAYRDYIQECEQLQLDLTDRQVLFPRDLRAAHARTMEQINFDKNKADQEKFATQVSKLERWAWRHGGLLIRPPREQEELKAEGKQLHHCVGGYVKRMADGETAIFFVRRASEPDTPYFTLELQGKRVVQCRTEHNKSYMEYPEVKEFVEQWLAAVVSGGGRKKKRTDAA